MRTRRTRTHLQISPLAGIENDTGVLAAVTVTVTGSEGKPAGWPEAAARVLLEGLVVDGSMAQTAGQGGRTKAGTDNLFYFSERLARAGGRLGCVHAGLGPTYSSALWLGSRLTTACGVTPVPVTVYNSRQSPSRPGGAARRGTLIR